MSRILRSVLFVAAHVALACALWFAVAAPVMDALTWQSENIATRADFLARLQAVAIMAQALETQARQAGERTADGAYLAGAGEGAVSANLQARLKQVAETAGAQLRSVRALPGRQAGAVAFAGARLEISGPMQAIQAGLHQIESVPPYLAVTSGIVRPAINAARPGADAEPAVEAQFDVYGAVRGAPAHE